LTDISTARYNYLDSSRGLAALVVLLSHFQLTILPQLNDSSLLKSPLKFFIDGQAAILYFFILSGYVLTLSLKNKSVISVFDYLKFIIIRIFRIFPAYIFTLIISLIVLTSIANRPETWLSQYWNGSTGLKSLLNQAILIVRIPNDPLLRLIPQDWTLTIEIAVSFLLPLLAALSSLRPVFVLILVYFSVQFLELDAFVFDFSLGIFIASHKDRMISEWKDLGYKYILMLLGFVLICADYLCPSQMKFTDLFLIHHKSWGIVILLWAIISSDKIQGILSWKPLVFLGKISYSFYLLHLIILLCLTDVLFNLNQILFLIVYLSITIIASSVTYRIIELPFNRFGKSLFSKKEQ